MTDDKIIAEMLKTIGWYLADEITLADCAKTLRFLAAQLGR